jgi:hypothetical protein
MHRNKIDNTSVSTVELTYNLLCICLVLHYRVIMFLITFSLVVLIAYSPFYATSDLCQCSARSSVSSLPLRCIRSLTSLSFTRPLVLFSLQLVPMVLKTNYGLYCAG